MTMSTHEYEVENKYRATDLESVRSRLHALGGMTGSVERQVDRYLAHPARDFAETGEALRLREIDGVVEVTYKGPQVAGSAKIRREITLVTTAGSEEDARTLFASLGFDPAMQVEKCRTPVALRWRGTEFEVGLDEVETLGSFVEIEVMTDAGGAEEAGQTISRLAEELGLGALEPRTYLEMALDVRRTS